MTVNLYVAASLYSRGRQPRPVRTRGGASDFCSPFPFGRGAPAGLGGGAQRTRRRYPGCPVGLWDARQHAPERHRLRRSVWTVSDLLGDLLGDCAVSNDSGNRQLRNPEGFHRRDYQRPAPASASDRVRLWRIHRRRGRIRRSGSGGRGDAGRARLPALLCRGDLPAGEHRPRGVRLHRDPYHHARRHHRTAARRFERVGGAHLRSGLRIRAGLPDSGHRRVPGDERSAPRRCDLRHIFRSDAIPGFQLRGPAAHRHRQLAHRDWRTAPVVPLLETKGHFRPGRRSGHAHSGTPGAWRRVPGLAALFSAGGVRCSVGAGLGEEAARCRHLETRLARPAQHD